LFIALLFDAFSHAKCMKKLCKVPHLALLFHANSLVKCRILQVYCVKNGLKRQNGVLDADIHPSISRINLMQE